MGSNAPLWALSAYLFVSLSVLWYLASILLAALYQRVLYPRWRKRSYDPAYRPRCALIVPCKGTPRHFQDNLLALLQQDYARYEVILSVEAESDPAVPAIRAAIAACCAIPINILRRRPASACQSVAVLSSIVLLPAFGSVQVCTAPLQFGNSREAEADG